MDSASAPEDSLRPASRAHFHNARVGESWSQATLSSATPTGLLAEAQALAPETAATPLEFLSASRAIRAE